VSRRAPCPVVVVAPGAELSLTNGNGARRAGFPGLLDDGSPGAAASSDAARGANPANGDLAGGIVRFSVGGGGK
jgi:hypothetical protein